MSCEDLHCVSVLAVVAGLLLASSALGDDAAVSAGAKARKADWPGVGEIQKMLPEHPAGLGRPITDRQAWDRLAGMESYKDVIPNAEKKMKTPLPERPDKFYLEFTQTGDRYHWQNIANDRRGRIATYTLAECLENKGRFIAPLTEAIQAVCAERTWVMPAHDGNLVNFNGKSIDIDLGSSHLAYQMAMTRYLLGDKLDQATCSLIEQNITTRVISPFQDMLRGKRKRNWWMDTTNNWNAVCLANVIGAGLTILESPADRAELVAAGLEYSKNFLRGFGADGYCTEGLGYWEYGFGHFMVLAEAIYQATDGKIDMFDSDRVRLMAIFPIRIEIINGVFPAFADCKADIHRPERYIQFLNRRYGFGLKTVSDEKMVRPSGSLSIAMMYSFPNSATNRPMAKVDADGGEKLRSWFDKTGVLICRPGENKRCRLGAAFKGGNNAEHHNHNDVGSYVVVLGDSPLLLDPGAEVYTSRTFSRRRYDSNVLNSFGHPVPRVAGKLQQPGEKYLAKVLSHKFTDDVDTLVMDIGKAYDVPEMKKLTRTFVYSRKDAGSVEIIDEVEFASPQLFETAIITMSKWRKVDDNTLLVHDDKECVGIRLEVQGGDFVIEPQEIKENLTVKTLPTRLAIRFTGPVTTARVSVGITPLPRKKEKDGQE